MTSDLEKIILYLFLKYIIHFEQFIRKQKPAGKEDRDLRHKSEEVFENILNFVNRYQEKNGYSPTSIEIADAISMSQATVSRYLNSMKESGRISSGGNRCIVTKEMGQQLGSASKSVSVPVLGAVSCGIPKYAEENIESRVRLPIELFGRGDFYILKADGDSMADAGIASGDLVLIRHQDDAERGQIVVALVDDSATLKRFYPEPENGRIRLHPENSRYDDIFVDHCEIQGVAVKVIKDLD